MLKAVTDKVIIQVIPNDTVNIAGIELVIVDKFRPDSWATAEGIVIAVSQNFSSKFEMIGDEYISNQQLSEQTKHIPVGSKVYFHPMAVFGMDSEQSDFINSFKLKYNGKEIYTSLQATEIFCYEKDGQLIPVNDNVLVEPIYGESEFKSKHIIIPFDKGSAVSKGLLNGEVVYFSNQSQIRTYKMLGKEYYIIKKNQIAAVEEEDGSLTITNKFIFIEPQRYKSISGIWLPPALEKELQYLARQTPFWIGKIWKASKQATLLLREFGMPRVEGMTIYVGSGYSFEIEIKGTIYWVINTLDFGDDSVVAYKDSEESSKEEVSL